MKYYIKLLALLCIGIINSQNKNNNKPLDSVQNLEQVFINSDVIFEANTLLRIDQVLHTIYHLKN